MGISETLGETWLPPHPTCVTQAERLNLSELQFLSCQMMPSQRVGPEAKRPRQSWHLAVIRTCAFPSVSGGSELPDSACIRADVGGSQCGMGYNLALYFRTKVKIALSV